MVENGASQGIGPAYIALCAKTMEAYGEWSAAVTRYGVQYFEGLDALAQFGRVSHERGVVLVNALARGDEKIARVTADEMIRAYQLSNQAFIVGLFLDMRIAIETKKLVANSLGAENMKGIRALVWPPLRTDALLDLVMKMYLDRK